MAGRPTKQGLDYFSLDVDFFTDIKIRKLIRGCGPNSIAILICVLCNIYRDQGYYIQWEEDMPFIVADEIGLTEEEVNRTVGEAIRVGFFSQIMYDKYNILTSARIQKMFLNATYQRKIRNFNCDYLVDRSIICANNSINCMDNTQRKEKESKVKKSKVNSKETSPNGESKKGELSLVSPSRINFEKLMDYFNTRFNGKLPTIVSISDKRRAAIKARAAEYGKEAVFKVLQKVEASSFLLGHNDENWRCDFDWIFRPTNFVKILEGSYDNKSANTDTVKGRKESVKNLRELAVAVLTGNATKVD